MIDREVWGDTTGLSTDEINMVNAYLTGGESGLNTYIGEDLTKKQLWTQLY
mgnify:FL=1